MQQQQDNQIRFQALLMIGRCQSICTIVCATLHLATLTKATAEKKQKNKRNLKVTHNTGYRPHFDIQYAT